MPESNWRPPDSLPDISRAKWMTLDVESHDPNLNSKGPGFIRKDAFVCGVAVKVDGFRGYYPVRHAQGQNLAPNVVFQWLRDTAKDFKGELLGANLLYDEEALWFEGVRFDDQVKRRDVQVIEALLDEETAEGYNLDALSWKYLNERKDESLLRAAAQFYSKGGKGRKLVKFNAKKDLWMMPPEYVGPYAEMDVELPTRIYEKQSDQLSRECLGQVFELESSLIPILLKMRIRGVRVDLERAEQLRATLTREIDRYSDQIKRLVGFHPNVDSGPDMLKAYRILDTNAPELGIASRLKETALGNPSFDADWYAEQPDPLSRIVLKKKKLMTLRDDFVVGDIVRESINGRIHCQFTQLRTDTGGTRTGRMASKNPNLQQVPARHDDELWGPDSPIWSKEVRALFVPDEGKRWFKGDYSQQEPRLTLHFAAKLGLASAMEAVQIFRRNPRTDYHQMTTDIVNRVSGRGFKRKHIKAINLGIIYGMGIYKLCRQLGVSMEEGKEILAEYHSALSFIKALANKAMSLAQERGWVRTILGRLRRFLLWEPLREFGKKTTEYVRQGLVRHLAEQRWPGQKLQRFGTHKALNSIIQGSAGDQTKEAMRQLYYDHGILMQIQVHDELDGSAESVEEAQAIKLVMEECVPLEIPVVCDAVLGDSWGMANEEVLPKAA